MIKTSFHRMPLEAIWLGMEVARFYEVSRDLGLVQPNTGLNFEDYSLLIFHHEIDISDDDGKTWRKKGASVFASIKTEIFRQHLVGEDGKLKREVNITMDQLHQFVAVYDEHLPGGMGNGDFLQPENLTKEREIRYTRKIHGQEKLQRYIYKQKVACEFASRIMRSLFKLDYPTDASGEEDARSVIDSIMKKGS